MSESVQVEKISDQFQPGTIITAEMRIALLELLLSWRERGEEIADLRTSVIAFLAPWAVRYAKDYELGGLHQVHYDILKKCGARMDDFKRAALGTSEEEGA